MKNFIIFTVIISLILLVNKSAFSEEIDVNQTFSTDTTFNPFPGPEVMYSLKITGNVEMHSLRSLIRVIVSTDKGEFMVFETYPLVSIDTILDFRDMCDETCYLDGVTPYSIRIETIDATINLDHLSYDKDFIENATSLQYQAKKEKDHEKVDLMNNKISELAMDWIAGNTSLVDLYYQDKKGIFNEGYNLLGYDYYSGGIYQLIGETYLPVTNFSLVHHWDWRNRHSANVPAHFILTEIMKIILDGLQFQKIKMFLTIVGLVGFLDLPVHWNRLSIFIIISILIWIYQNNTCLHVFLMQFAEM